MKKFYVFAVLALFLMLAGCKKSVLYRSDSDKTFNFVVGDEFSIRLPDNPSTGYSWHFKTVPASQQVISLISNQFHAPKTKSVGAGGERSFFWQAVTVGSVEVYGFYKRPWSGSQKEPSVSYKIVVEQKN